MDYQKAWDTLRAWLETDCANGQGHKARRALSLMEELEEKDKKEKEDLQTDAVNHIINMRNQND